MAARKWESYILVDPPNMDAYPKDPDRPKMTPILMQNGMRLKGAFHVNVMWVNPGPNPGVYEAHYHPHDEMIGFIGTDPNNPSELGGEAVLWIEDEKYVITKSFLAYFPRGIVHCPLTVNKVTRPILHFDIQLSRHRPKFSWAKDLPSKNK